MDDLNDMCYAKPTAHQRLEMFKGKLRATGIQINIDWRQSHSDGQHNARTLEHWTLTKQGSRKIMMFIVDIRDGGYDLYQWSDTIEVSKDIENIVGYFK